MKRLILLTVIVLFSAAAFATAAPNVISSFPFPDENNVPVDTLITAQFQDPVDSASLSFRLLAPAKVTDVDAGFLHALALRDDGTVVGFGMYNEVPAGLTHVVSISAGAYHSLALKDDGTVVGWGRSELGQADVPSGLDNVIDIAGGQPFSIALKADGTVVDWGGQQGGWTGVPAGVSHVVDIEAGYYHALALKDDGTVVAWGRNSEGQTNVPSDLENVVAIAAGSFHSYALKADGTVVSWGNGPLGSYYVEPPAGLTDIVDISPGTMANCFILGDGSVTGTYNASTLLGAWTDIVDVAASYYFYIGLKADGTIVKVNCGSYNLVIPPDVNLSEIPATLSYDEISATATLRPETPLALAQAYTAAVMAESVFGEAMVAPYKWSFVTRNTSNTPPVANAGTSQSVVQGQVVILDGGDSFDADNDPLYFTWDIVDKPMTSSAYIADISAETTSLVPDVPGDYRIVLTVNDGTVDSEVSRINVLVTSYQDATLQSLQATSEQIRTLGKLAFKNGNLQKAYGNKLNAAIKMVSRGEFDEAWEKLEFDLLQKVDGCLKGGAPDGNDWLEYCSDQNQIAGTFIQTINNIAGAVNWTDVLADYSCDASAGSAVKMVFSEDVMPPAIGTIQCSENPDKPTVDLLTEQAPVNRPSLIRDGEVIFGDAEAVSVTLRH